VTYNGTPDTWTVSTQGNGSSGTLNKQGNTWTGSASNGNNVTLSLVITQGTSLFQAGDSFQFSTFKSTANLGKQFEIGLGSADVTTGP
jgi:hypothetical protein